MLTPEKRIQNEILDYLKDLKLNGYPIFYERRQAGGGSYRKGMPDIYAVISGIHIEIEVKAPNGSLSTLQEKYRDYFLQRKVKWICVDDINQLKEYIKENHLL